MYAIILAVMAGLFWAAGELLTKMALSTGQIGPIAAVAVRCVVEVPVIGLVYLILVSRYETEPTQWWFADKGVLLKVVIGSGVLAGAGGLTCFYLSLKFGEITTVKPIAFTVAPATAVLLAVIFLGERPSMQKWAGVACVLIGVILIATANKSRSAGVEASKETDPSLPK